MADVTQLHYSTSFNNFTQNTNEVLKKWASNPSMDTFREYFVNQWLQGSFVNWQLFNTPPGYATTNNPEESFNKQIKESYTEYKRLTILTACDKICVLVKDYSLAQKSNSFALVASRNNKFIEASKTCQAQDFVLYNNNPNTLYYKSKHYITLLPRFCSCGWFLNYANCKHYIAACLLMNFVCDEDREFAVIKGRGRPKGSKGALKK